MADQRIPEARLEDPDEVDAVSTAISLRAARLGAGQVHGEFVVRLRRLLAAEFAELPAAPRLALITSGPQPEHPPSATVSRYVMTYQRAFHLGVPPEQVWEAIQQIDRFQQWWGWLTELRLDGHGLQSGTVLTGVISPPLPYRMRVSLVFGRCIPPSIIDAAVHGDLEGVAQLRLSPEPGGTRASVAWKFEMMEPAMRWAALVASPVLRWGHDRVVEATVADFHRHLEQDG